MSKWQWRSFGNLYGNSKYGIKGEWYKPMYRAPKPVKPWVNPYHKPKPYTKRIGWSIKPQQRYIDPFGPYYGARMEAIAKRNQRQAFYKLTNTKPRFVIKT